MSSRPLLIELFTEELPPKALPKLGQAFAQGIHDALQAHGLLASQNQVEAFATPRRLAVRLSQVLSIAPEQSFTEKLMPVKVGLDANGAPTPALLKKLAAKGWENLDISSLGRESDGKQEYLIASGRAPGANLRTVLQGAIESAINALPIPKVMRYQLDDGVTTVKFVRPAHALIALHGDEIIPAEILGLKSGNITHGHRFLHPGPITIVSADTYENQLAAEGRVIASFTKRRTRISDLLSTEAARLGASLGDDPAVDALL
ncbi:MAG TPA: glycine--tRNA ligase subunit beta, partial [Alcaligenaceae bacterium]|nr:glycine--tRNA ligase subunit beta [Alcaligenaceae bacterium]